MKAGLLALLAAITLFSGTRVAIPETYQVDWCSGDPRPAKPKMQHLSGTAWNPDQYPLLCLNAKYGKRYKTWCYAAEDKKPSQQCVGVGSSSCGSVGWVYRGIYPDDWFYSKCIKISRQDDKAKYFDLFYIEMR